ncbi:MAG TPA: hypothetical protein VHH36_01180, partial [Candidatus Thermoplasmatota archaeon]|nr:hypothetical protein [Candidatus Thermoplasmatota archaeon]
AKWKVGHRRPGWRRWSTEYPGRESARDRTIAVLRETLARLESDRAARAPRIEAALSPEVYGPRDARLDDWIRPTPEELELDAEA